MAELNQSDLLVRSYVWGSDLSGTPQGAGGVGELLEVSYHGSSVTNCFPAFDGNGNVAALISAADGTIAANYEYAAFGEPIRATGAMAKNNPFRFSTKYDDDESDLLYYGYRYYKPSTGTWPNRDPLQEDGSLNLYCFCVNSPANQVDFLGQSIVFNPIQLPPHNNPNPSGNGLSQTGNTTATFDNVKWNSTPCSCGGASFTFSGTLTVKDWWVNGDHKAKAHEEHHVALWKQALDSINTFQTPDTCVPSCYGNIMNAALSAGVAQGNYLNAQFDADQYGNIDPPAVTRSANALAAYNKALNDFLNAYAHCMQK